MASFDFKSPEFSGLQYLRDYHTFGRRSGTVDTVINQTYISKLHAVVEWRESAWYLKDVSKNGLKLNDKVIPAQKQVQLKQGDIIDFAGMNEVTLTMLSVDAPQALLINTKDSSKTITLAESVLLPNESAPELALYLCPDREQWFADDINKGEEIGPFEHDDKLDLNGTQWQFMLISEDDATTEFDPKQTTLDDITFRFDVSQNEENTNLTVIDQGLEIDLGERSHHYLLVHLLRHRKTDNSNSGWLDSQLLMKERGLEETHMTIQIVRARKQVSKALPNAIGHSKLIERRRGALRANISNIEIFKEGIKEV